MKAENIKLPIAVIGVIVAQAFGIIWYVATLDSTVKQLQATVEEIRSNTVGTSVAVIKNDVAHIKSSILKLDRLIEVAGTGKRSEELDHRVTALEKAIKINHPKEKKKKTPKEKKKTPKEKKKGKP
jgi:hypothetical protein